MDPKLGDLTTATIQPRMYKSPPFSVEVPGSPYIKGETKPRRHPLCVNSLVSRPSEEINTVFDIFLHSSKKYGDFPAVGTRDLIKIHDERKTRSNENGKEIVEKWTFYELGKYMYLSFREHEALVLQLGAGLKRLGLSREDKLHIFAATSARWLASAHAAMSQSIAIVTSYATLGAEGLITSLVQTGARAIFIDCDLIHVLTKALVTATEVKVIIYNDSNMKEGEIDKLKAAHSHITILSFEELRFIGEKNPEEPLPPNADDLCCIMYTSGSTGTPKGVELTHRNIIAAVAGLDLIVGRYISPKDSILAYLPLAHSFEFAFENACFFWGVPMGYGNPRTLTDTSMRNCKGDIKELKPSILIGVPAVWETIRKAIQSKVSKEGAFIRAIFGGAMGLKQTLLAWNLPGVGVLDALVFQSVKKETGGRLRACFNGAGPVSRETTRFISLAVVPLISGYGLTETSAMGALMDPLEWTDDTLGDIPGCIEIKLVDYPDAGYLASSNPSQGEILIRGDAVMRGYFKNSTETAKVITSDGWFLTGDIGEWATNGHLKIIDRKKNLVKTLNGEYIALEKLESIYKSASFVANICVYAATDRARPVAIIVPIKPALKILAQENHIEEKNDEELCGNLQLRAILLHHLQNTGHTAGLSTIELIEGVVITDFEWTSKNGLLTATQKLNRRRIVPMYQKDIDALYLKSKM